MRIIDNILKRKENEEKNTNYNSPIPDNSQEYCNWFTKYTKAFVDGLKNNGFNPSWGFETFITTDYLTGADGKKCGYKYIFDVQPLKALAFDMESKQIVYITCNGENYDKFEKQLEPHYKCTLIPFNEIFNAKVEIDSQPVFVTTANTSDIFKRSVVGGILAGDTGSVIGGITAGKNIKTKESINSVAFYIQTLNEDHPIISFEFDYKKAGLSDRCIQDIMYSMFSDKNELFEYYKRTQDRTNGTTTDYVYYRKLNIYNYDGNNPDEYRPILDYIEKTNNFDYIKKRFNKYVMQIEAIITQCNSENTNQQHQNNNHSIVDELQKLSELKSNGFITDMEFENLKTKLLQNI